MQFECFNQEIQPKSKGEIYLNLVVPENIGKHEYEFNILLIDHNIISKEKLKLEFDVINGNNNASRDAPNIVNINVPLPSEKESQHIQELI